MKSITFRIDDDLIERARLRAARERKTLNAAFRDWLQRYAATETSRQEYVQLMKRLRHVRSGGRFSRDETNER